MTAPEPSTDLPPNGVDRLLAWHPQNHPLWVRLLVALAITGLAAWLRIALAPAESGGRFITFALAVVLCTMYGGFASGLFSTVVGMVLANYFLVKPYGSLVFADPVEALWLNGWHFVTQLVVISSITLVQRKHHRLLDAAQQVREGHKQLEDTFEHSATGMAHSHIDGRWIRVNQTYCDIVGYAREEVLGMTFKDFTHPDDIALDLMQLERTLAGEIDHYRVEKRYLRKGGQTIWVHLTVSLIRKPDGSPDYLIAVVQDITQRKASEQALEMSEKLLVQAQNIAGLASWRADVPRNQFTTLGDSHRILGLPSAHFTGEQLLQMAHPDDRDLIESVWLKAIKGEQPYFIEYRVILNGAERWFSAQAEFERDAQGRALHALGVTRDITLQKKAEQEVLTLNASLEQRIQARTQALKAAYEELESYSYAVAHDLRSPLRIINGFAMALQEDNAALDVGSQQHLRRIMDASKKMGELIDGLLKLAQYARGETHRVSVNLSTIATRHLEELAHHEPRRRVTWEVQDQLVAHADQALMEALLQNLLGNAWKYTALKEDAHIRVHACPDGRPDCFCVSDNGAGFDMSRQDKLFKPFQRLHMPHEFSGLGIGLATALRIVQRHGGELWAESSPGAGARFSFTLPVEATKGSLTPA